MEIVKCGLLQLLIQHTYDCPPDTIHCHSYVFIRHDTRNGQKISLHGK